jgi:formate dehydrogenase beta subunit
MTTPHDLTPNTWTLMRYTEYENPRSGNLEWLIGKDGCMHCEDPGCLKACPAPGAVVQYSNGIVDFIHENCIGCGYCVKGCRLNIPRISQVDHKALQVHALFRPRCGRPGTSLPEGLSDPGDRVRQQGRYEAVGRQTHRRFEIARL